MSALEEQIKQIMATVFDVPVEEIGPDASIDSLDAWDSLKHMELIAGLEQSTGVQFTADEIVEMVSLTKLKAVMESKG